MKGLPWAKVRAPKTRNNEFHLVIMGIIRAVGVATIDEVKRKNIPLIKVIRITSRATNQPTPLVRVFTKSRATRTRPEQWHRPGVTEVQMQTTEREACWGTTVLYVPPIQPPSKRLPKRTRLQQVKNTREKSAKQLLQSAATVEKDTHLVTKAVKWESKKYKLSEMPGRRLKMQNFTRSRRKKGIRKSRCQNIEKDWEEMTLPNSYNHQTLHYIKGNVPGTSLTTEDIEQFVAKQTLRLQNASWRLQFSKTPSFQFDPNTETWLAAKRS